MPTTDKFGFTLFNAADAHNVTFEEFWKAICLNDTSSNFYKIENNIYSKGEIDQLIGSIETIRVVKVEHLPETGESNTIYLVPQDQSTQNIYEEYLWVDNAWELIGSTEISLDNYYTKDEVDAIETSLQNSIDAVDAKIEKPVIVHAADTASGQFNQINVYDVIDISDMSISSDENFLREVLENLGNLDREYIKHLIGEPGVTTNNIVFDTESNRYIFIATSENSADVICYRLVDGTLYKYFSSISMEVDPETGDEYIEVTDSYVRLLDGSTIFNTSIDGPYYLKCTEDVAWIIKEMLNAQTIDQQFVDDRLAVLDPYKVAITYSTSDGIIDTYVQSLSQGTWIPISENAASISYPRFSTEITVETDAETGVSKLAIDPFTSIIPQDVEVIDCLFFDSGDERLPEIVLDKQDTLVSGTNIKTINNQSLLGSGDIQITSGTDVIANPTLEGDEAELTGLEVDSVKYKVTGGEVTQSEFDWLVDSVQALAAQSGHSLAMASYQDGGNTTLTGEDESGNNVPIIYEEV